MKITIDTLTDHLSSFLTHALDTPASEIFQKEMIKDYVYIFMSLFVNSLKKLKIPQATLRPLRIFLTKWYPSYVATHLHCEFAQMAIFAKAYHYAYPLMK